DLEDARAGLEDGTYAAIVVIPEDFSTRLATLGTPEAVQARVSVYTDDASGSLTALLSSAIADAAAATMSSDLTRQYLDGIYVGFGDMKDGFTEAADGAEELAEGSHELADGVTRTSEGAGELAEGTDQ